MRGMTMFAQGKFLKTSRAFARPAVGSTEASGPGSDSSRHADRFFAGATSDRGARRGRLLGAKASRLAVGGLVAILVLQGAFIRWAALRVDSDGKVVEDTIRINGAFQVADAAGASMRLIEHQYLVAPAPHLRADFMAASDRFRGALNDIETAAATAHPVERAATRELRQLYDDHLVRALQTFDLRDAGADTTSDRAQLQADIDVIDGKLAAVYDFERTAVVNAVAALRGTEGLLVTVAPVGFLVGLAVIALCAAVIAAHRRATERERRAAEGMVRLSERRYRSLVENGADLVMVLNPGRGISYVSPACERILGMDAETIKSMEREDLFYPDDLVRFVAARTRCEAMPGLVIGPIQARMRHSDGRWLWFEIGLSNRMEDTDVAGFVANCHDITNLKAAQAELVHNATHDVLTGLPNRALLVDRLEQAIARYDPDKGTLAVLFCDLDGFKVLNDSRGHSAGDAVLKAVAQRLVAAVRPQDTVARFGGDEFVVCCEGLANQAEALSVATRLREALAPPISTGDDEIFLTASIGLRTSAALADSPEDLIRDADAAMYQAKANGRDQAVVYSEVLREQNEARLMIESGLRRALERDELRVYYQPVVAVESGSLVGVEALVRWEHPTRGLVPPSDFIAVAEDTGLIEPIGAWVLERACQQLHDWEQDGAAPLRMAVNLSGRQLRSAAVVETVANILSRTGVDPGNVCLEVTESVLMDDPDAAVTILSRLRELGVHLAIDDFGTGYSSLAHLRRFPVDSLKIDRSFVANLGEEPEATAIVTAIVHLARALDLTTVAEGVESAAQRNQLQLLGCQLGQGYHWGPPLPAEHMRTWLTQTTSLVPAALSPRPPKEAYSVLVVDDDRTHRTAIGRILHRSGKFTVVGEAADGRAAVDEAAACKPDLVLLDLSMPNVSGLEALPHILHSSPDTKVVLLSGAADESATVPAGASAFVSKGVRPPDLIEELLLVLGVGAELAA